MQIFMTFKPFIAVLSGASLRTACAPLTCSNANTGADSPGVPIFARGAT